MFKVGDKVEVVYEYFGFNSGHKVGTIGIVVGYNQGINQKYRVKANGEEWSQTEGELKLAEHKYLVYNATSQKSVGIMTKNSALAHAKSTPQCEFQLYELKYNIVPKPVDVQYEAVEV